MDIWYDEFEIKPGMSIRESVDKGLSFCDVGLIILSSNYFNKRWTIWELNGIIQKMLSGKALIIPIWLDITHSELLGISPPLADILGISSNQDLSDIALEIHNLIYPNEPILITANKILRKYGYNAPDYYDNWWVEVIEFLGKGDVLSPWFFPKNPNTSDSQLKSNSIAWAGLRYSWLQKCVDMHFNQFTPPDIITNTIEKIPGMSEACNNNIEYLALYAPQLLFKDNIFTNIFSSISASYKEQLKNIVTSKSYKCSLTNEGQIPTCNRIFALMDNDFGFYLPLYLLMHFIEGESFGPRPSYLGYWEALVYLCSSRSNIYPDNVKDILLQGYYNKYIIDKLRAKFIDQSNDNISKIFADVNLIDQVVQEIILDYTIEISDDTKSIAQKIYDMDLFGCKYKDLFVRITIPQEDISLGFRGITYQAKCATLEQDYY